MDRFSEVNGKFNNDDFEKELASRTEELIQERYDYYKNRGEEKRRSRLREERRLKQKARRDSGKAVQSPLLSWTNGRRLGFTGREVESEDLAIYKAKAALNRYQDKGPREEGFIHRTWRLIIGLIAVMRQLYSPEARLNNWYSAENRRQAYGAVFNDCWEPYINSFHELFENLWDFICRFGRDLLDCILFIGDMLITAGYYLFSLVLFIGDWLWDLAYWIGRHKRTLFGIFVIGVSGAAAIAVFISSLSAYEYSYHGKTLGLVRNREDVFRTVEVVGNKLSEAAGMEVSFDVERDIEFNKVYGFRMDIDTPDEVLNTITYMRDLQVKAYGLLVAGEQRVILEDEDAVDEILASIKRDATIDAEDTKVTSVEFVEDISTEEVTVSLGDIWNKEDAKRYLQTGYVKAGEVQVSRPILNVKTTENFTYVEEIDYGTKYINNANLYADETELITAGVPGENEVEIEITRLNGKETARATLSTTRISEPVDEVYYKGTKPLPERTGTGTFIYPVSNYILSSRFGPRWGRMHKGIDLACPTGTKVVASDGGTVTFAGWSGSYGYYVKIDHGGFFETLYAHNSKLLVEVGDEVYQGKTIALSGSTGNSTGPHCHFEVQYKGEQVDPMNYLP